MLTNHNKKIIVLVILVAIFVGLFPIYMRKEAGEYMGTKVISSEEAEELSRQKQKVSIVEYGGLQINGVRVPYDAESETWYVS